MRPLDLLVLAVYLTGMLGAGYYFSRRNNSTEEYFLGGRAFPGWAIGLSMLGTSISSITFLAFPADGFAHDWRNLVSNWMLPLSAVLAVLVFIPFFRFGRRTTAFEYLGQRFGPVARLYGAMLFLLLQAIRLGIVLLLVSYAVQELVVPTGAVADAHRLWILRSVVVLVGLFIAYYTVAGGIDAVIWTDVIQALVLWFGGAVCLAFIVWHLPGGFTQILSLGAQHDKFYLGSAELHLNEKTLWTVTLLGAFNYLAMYASDQNVVQRYMASRSVREAQKATILYTVAAVPTWTFFFLLGTSLFAFYQVFPNADVAAMTAASKPERVFPYFILNVLPAGLGGLVIAGVLAAAMSSLDSSLNAIATVLTVDVVRPYLAPGRDDQFYLRTARRIAAGAAALMIASALGFRELESASLNEVNWITSSIFGGCLLGMFLLGFFTRRVGYRAVMIAVAVATFWNVYLVADAAHVVPEPISLKIHSFWAGPLVNLLFVVVAYAASFLTGEPMRDLRGLTIWTIDRSSMAEHPSEGERGA